MGIVVKKVWKVVVVGRRRCVCGSGGGGRCVCRRQRIGHRRRTGRAEEAGAAGWTSVWREGGNGDVGVGVATECGSGCQPIRELVVAISVSGCEVGRERENAEWECIVWVHAVCECGWGGQKRFSSEFIENSSVFHR